MGELTQHLEWTSKGDESQDTVAVRTPSSGGKDDVAFVVSSRGGAYLDASDTLDAAKTLLAILNAKTGSEWVVSDESNNRWVSRAGYDVLANERDDMKKQRDEAFDRVASLTAELAMARGKPIQKRVVFAQASPRRLRAVVTQNDTEVVVTAYEEVENG